MKNLTYAMFLLLVVLAACNNQSKQKKQPADTTSKEPAPDTSATAIAEGTPIDYSTAIVLDTLFVMPEKGTALRETPSDAAPVFKQLQHADVMHVIERQGKWLGVMQYVNRKYTDDGKQVSTSRWERLYVAAKDAARANQMRVIPADLNLVSALFVNGKAANLEKPQPLNTLLTFELVDQDTYKARQAAAVNFLDADTNAITKVKGVISLPINNGFKKFVDKATDNDEAEEFKYEGQIKNLNAYLISAVYFESWGIKLVNTGSGKVMVETGAFPYLSASKTHIISVAGSAYEGDNTTVQLVKVTPTGLKMILEANMDKWFPVDEKTTDAFWSDDNCFYIPIVSAPVFLSGFDVHKLKPQYLRIGLK